jgi:hypothetical protein
MSLKKQMVLALIAALALTGPMAGVVKKTHGKRTGHGETAGSVHAVLWRNPADIESRNLFYGPGGESHQPRAPFTFIKEDRSGSNPKFVVRDAGGMKWKVKLGAEARPETAASRLVWAAGYFANEDYYLSDMQVRNMSKLHRGASLVGPGGSVHDARLKREPESEKKAGHWRWRNDAFTGTRELNGLIVMMALINNWDLKDVNNAIVEEAAPGSPDLERVYMVSDLGASFGAPRFERPIDKSRGNLKEYSRSRFIRNIDGDGVDFESPARPSVVLLVNPFQYFRRVSMRHIGHDVPRRDARWMGQLLARLSPRQIEDAFRAAGYGPQEVEGFARIVEQRIDTLNSL